MSKATTYTTNRPYDSGEESAETIISLLGEYSQRLRDRFEQFETARRQKYLWLCAYLSIILGAFLIDYFVLKTPFFGISFVGSLTVAILPVILVLFLFEGFKDTSLREESFVVTSQLRRILERASTLEDHVLRDFDKRFELDLRIRDAELILRKAQPLLSKKHQP